MFPHVLQCVGMVLQCQTYLHIFRRTMSACDDGNFCIAISYFFVWQPFFLQFLKTRLMTAEARTNARRFQSVLARILAPNGAGCNKATHVIFEARWWYQVFITYGTMAAVKLRTSASSMYMYRAYMLLRSTVRAISCYRCRPFGPSSDVEFDEVVFLPFAIPRVHYFI